MPRASRRERNILVLSRKAGEKIIIGDGIEVTVTRISGNRVTIGVSAPGEVPIVRHEISGTVNVAPTPAEKAAKRLERMRTRFKT